MVFYPITLRIEKATEEEYQYLLITLKNTIKSNKIRFLDIIEKLVSTLLRDYYLSHISVVSCKIRDFYLSYKMLKILNLNENPKPEPEISVSMKTFLSHTRKETKNDNKTL